MFSITIPAENTRIHRYSLRKMRPSVPLTTYPGVGTLIRGYFLKTPLKCPYNSFHITRKKEPEPELEVPVSQTHSDHTSLVSEKGAGSEGAQERCGNRWFLTIKQCLRSLTCLVSATKLLSWGPAALKGSRDHWWWADLSGSTSSLYTTCMS